MQTKSQSVIELKVNGCPVSLHFVAKSVDGVIENVQSILSNAYDERIKKEIKEIVGTDV